MQKTNELEIKRARALKWGYLFAAFALVLFVVFVARIAVLQNTNVDQFRDNYINKNFREAKLKAARGNLYASDGSILATTVMRYDIYIDFKVVKDEDFASGIGALSDSLNSMFGKPRSHYRSILEDQFSKKNQYFSLVRGLDFDQYERIRKFPIFSTLNEKTNERKKNRCMIVDRKYKRELATTQIGAGTIGMDNEAGKSGLEGAFSEYLRGTDGKRLEQRINARQWKPIDYWKVSEPVDGQDVYTTIDLRIQDIAHSALEKQLVNFDADHGSVVVMETATGKVRALVNLRRTEKGMYADAYNYALKDGVEHGSTIKTVSLLAAMDDGFVDANTKVNIGGSSWTYYSQRITDSHPGGEYDLSDILAQSSNIGVSKIITKHYEDKPQVFLNHLKRWKLDQKMDIELPGITKPFFVTPEHSRWNKATLASISYGYSITMNLLQLTTFYNGIANKGKMVKPLFIDKIMKDGHVTYSAKPEVMVQKMASKEAIELMTAMLTKAVEKGTAKSIFTPNIKLAGKTGTARFEYWKRNQRLSYQASFAGFYPADNPKYTCIVMVNQPDNSKGFYGSVVAAPVFKEIAGKTFLKTPLNVNQEMLVEKKVDLGKMLKPKVKVAVRRNQMPNVVGLAGSNIIPQLENQGYRVDFNGAGKIREQFPLPGTTIRRNQKIYLSLQN